MEMHPWTLLPALQKHLLISYSAMHSSLPDTFNNSICSQGFFLADFSGLAEATLSILNVVLHIWLYILDKCTPN